MTTGRINQVAAFLAHPPGRSRGGAPAVRTVQTPPKRTQELVSTDQVSSCHAERPTRLAVQQQQHTPAGKAPFLRILAENSFSTLQRFGDGTPGVSKHGSRRDSRRGGCAASRLMPLKEPQGLRTDTNCSGNGFGGMLAHRVLIQAPQPRLHPGTRHRGSPPLAGLAPNQQALIRTWETEPIACSATGCSTQEREVTHQLLGSSIRLTRLSLGKLWSAAAVGSCLLDCFTSPLLDLGPPAFGHCCTNRRSPVLPPTACSRAKSGLARQPPETPTLTLGRAANPASPPVSRPFADPSGFLLPQPSQHPDTLSWKWAGTRAGTGCQTQVAAWQKGAERGWGWVGCGPAAAAVAAAREGHP